MVLGQQFRVNRFKKQIAALAAGIRQRTTGRGFIKTRMSEFAFTDQHAPAQLAKSVAIAEYAIQQAHQMCTRTGIFL